MLNQINEVQEVVDETLKSFIGDFSLPWKMLTDPLDKYGILLKQLKNKPHSFLKNTKLSYYKTKLNSAKNVFDKTYLIDDVNNLSADSFKLSQDIEVLSKQLKNMTNIQSKIAINMTENTKAKKEKITNMQCISITNINNQLKELMSSTSHFENNKTLKKKLKHLKRKLMKLNDKRDNITYVLGDKGFRAVVDLTNDLIIRLKEIFQGMLEVENSLKTRTKRETESRSDPLYMRIMFNVYEMEIKIKDYYR